MRSTLPLSEVEIPAGVHRDKTAYEAGRAIIDANRIRWHNGRIYSIGGWQPFTTLETESFDTITGVPRSVFAWTGINGFRQLAIGTNTDILVIENGGWKSIKPTGLAAGNASKSTKAGWGSGAWGGSNDGDPNTVGPTDTGWGKSIASIQDNLRLWSIHNYGEDLIVTPTDGTIYYWDLSTGSATKAVAITDAPARVLFSFVFSPVPFVFACGCTNLADEFDPMVVRWSSDDDYESWTPGVPGSTSGLFKFQGGSTLVGALNTRSATLIWSDTSLFQITLTGNAAAPFAFDTAGTNCGLVSQNAAAEADGSVYWMGSGGFYMYNGSVTKIDSPLDTTIFGDGFLSLNRFHKDKVHCGLNSDFNEIWWFYPTINDSENCRYVVYNYKMRTWYDGEMRRTTWLDSQLFETPLATSDDGVLWVHETGTDDYNSPMNSFFKTGTFALDAGTEMLYCDRFIPDFNVTGSLEVKILGQRYPQDKDVTQKGPFTFYENTEQVPFRLRGRTMQLEVRQNEKQSRFDLGVIRLRLTKDGNR